MLVGLEAEVVVCRTRRSYSKCPAIVLCYLEVAQEVAATHSEVARRVALAVVLPRLAHWHSEEAEEGDWS